MAGNTLMSLLISLGVDNSELKKGLDTAEKSSASVAKSISANFTNAGASMMKAGGMMTAGLSAPIALIGKNLIDAASDLE